MSSSLGSYSQSWSGGSATGSDHWFAGSSNIASSVFTITGFFKFSWTGSGQIKGDDTKAFLYFEDAELPVVPVPAPVVLAGLGLVGVGVLRRRVLR